MKKRIISMCLALALMAGLSVSASATVTGSMENFTDKQTYTEGQFTDVNASDWFGAGTAKMYSLGLMNGTGGATFSPMKNITAPEIYLLMARIADLYIGGTGEISGDWQTAGYTYLQEKGLAVDLQAAQDGTVARAYVVGQLMRILPASEFEAINTVDKLPDVNGETPYSAEILILYRAGVLTGGDDYGTFSPNSPITRGELATVLGRVVESQERKSFTLDRGYAGVGVNTGMTLDYNDLFANLPNAQAVIDKYGVVGGASGTRVMIKGVALKVNSDFVEITGFDYSSNDPVRYDATMAFIRDICDNESGNAIVAWFDELSNKRDECISGKITKDEFYKFIDAVLTEGNKTQFGNVYLGGNIESIKIYPLAQ